MDYLVGYIISVLVAAFVIWIVSRLKLGLSIDGYGDAIIAAILIAVISAVFMWLLDFFKISIGGDLLDIVAILVVAVVVLLLAGRFLPGLDVNGFLGAVVAAVAMAVISWLVFWLLSLVGIDISTM